ncbi:MAG: ferredoxin:glutaredoxin reductase [Candidatus Thermoplasmatota archaeon]|jgi:ferredoxin-thioredoxin reductase catalytic subunit|nr:ferredoxin:glutaredoxin reductase [Candidatus Thermoplasmatota archaeon]
MNDKGVPTDSEAATLRDRLEKDAKQSGYNLNPDKEFTVELARGLLVNESRYGYWACPCRLADGTAEKDNDIICPCDYRDKDLDEFGACYCALYVDDDIRDGKRQPMPIPERRPLEAERKKGGRSNEPGPISNALFGLSGPKYPVWRCNVCGYLCARDEPPLVCPICKAKKDRFERFI